VGRASTSGDLNYEFLAHYGVKGMKWGVHRDKLTAPAKGFYARAKKNPAAGAAKTLGVIGDLKGTKVRNKEQLKEYVKTAPEHIRAAEVKRKQRVAGVQTLTNDDLRDVITRMNLEMQYKNLKKAEFEDSYLGAGGKFVGGILQDIVVDAASSWIKRPGSNVSGRTTRRIGSSIGAGVGGQRAIGA
jgi:hypothetical protein